MNRSLLALVALLVPSCGVTTTPDAGPGTWRAVPSMSHPRAGATAAVLADGRVLVAGGVQNFGTGATLTLDTELFDPATERWSAGGALIEGRNRHAGVTLRSGEPFVIGGLDEHDVGLARTELYDQGTLAWRRSGALHHGRAYHVAIVLPDGRVLVAGGYPDNAPATLPLASAELYDPDAGQWSETGALGTARAMFSAALLPGGQVLVVGGCVSTDCSVTTAATELWDPDGGTWTAGPPLPIPLAVSSLVALPAGQLLLAGGCSADGSCGDEGRSAWRYDPAARTWTRAGLMASGHALGASLLLPSGRVLVAAGDNPAGGALPPDLYDPVEGRWESTGPLFAWHGSWSLLAPLPGGRALLVGGLAWDGEQAMAVREAEVYEP